VHLLFFYGVVVTVLWRAKSMRHLLHPAHFIGLALMAGIFFAWEIPYHRTEEAKQATQVWKDELANRFTDNKSPWRDYLMNFPRALSDLLPWVLLAPAVIGVARRKETEAQPSPIDANGAHQAGEEADWSAVKPVAVAMLAVSIVMFFGLLLIPGMLPRYVLPLIAPLALGSAILLDRTSEATRRWWHHANQGFIGILVVAALLAPVAAAVVLGTSGEFEGKLVGLDWKNAVPAIFASTITFIVAGLLWSRRALMLSPSYLAISSAAVLAAGSLTYGAVAPRWLSLHDEYRPVAAQIDKSLPADAELVIFDPGYQSALFYLKSRVRYAATAEDIPAAAPYVLARARDEGELSKKRPEFVRTYEFNKMRGREQFILLQPKTALPSHAL
jgi:hypothetical protein